MNSKRHVGRMRRHIRIRNKISGTSSNPRISVFRSAKHIGVQLIDDVAGKTLCSASTYEKEFKEKKVRAGKEIAKKIGVLFAQRAKSAGIKRAVFDRAGFRYHGRIKELADAVRSGGIEF